MSCYVFNRSPVSSFTERRHQDPASLQLHSTSNDHRTDAHQAGTCGDRRIRAIAEGTYQPLNPRPMLSSLIGEWQGDIIGKTVEDLECSGLSFREPRYLLRHCENFHAESDKFQTISQPHSPTGIAATFESKRSQEEETYEEMEQFGEMDIDLRYNGDCCELRRANSSSRESLRTPLLRNVTTLPQILPMFTFLHHLHNRLRPMA